MMALQIQDITSQQLAAVKHLIDSMQIRLKSILDKVDNSEFKDLLNISKEKSNVTKLHREIAFDPDAVDSIDKSKNRQQFVDEVFSNSQLNYIIENNLEKNSLAENSEQLEDIFLDKNKNVNENELTTLEKDKKVAQSQNTKKVTDYDDNLLKDLDGNISQDDIDKLFGG